MTAYSQAAPAPKFRSLAAFGWSAADVAGRQGIQFLVMLVLARLLAPAEFGILGMLALFIALANSVVDSGFGMALIQRKEISESDKSSVFLFNAAMGALMALAVSAAAPWIAGFYRQPILEPLTRLMALDMFIGSFGVVQLALLARDLDFRTPCRAGIAAALISGATAIAMAWKGYGVWSLAAQALVCTTVSTGLIWLFCPWKPHWHFRLASLRSLFGFGSRVLASGLLNTFFDRIQLTVIGKAFSPAQLGYYTRAFSTQQVPVSFLTAIVNRVTFPLFSQTAGDSSALRRTARKALVNLMIPTLPMMFGLALVAKPFVAVVFGSKWLPCVPYLQVLSVAGALWPIQVINLDVIMALGRSDLFLRLEIAKKFLIAVGILATFRISVMAMVWAVFGVWVVCLFLNSSYSRELIGYGTWTQLADVAPYAGVSLLMGVVTLAVLKFGPGQPVLQLVCPVAAGAAFYGLVCHLLRLESYRAAFSSTLAVFTRRAGTPAQS